jgi:dCTP deaminase
VILSDHDIRFFRNLDMLNIEPWDDRQVQPASYDLTLGEQVTWFEIVDHDENHDPIYGQRTANMGLGWTLHQGEFVLLHTAEVITLSNKVGAQVMGKSTRARQGLIVESAGWVDPGFPGQLVLEVTNLSMQPVRLTPGMKIAQIVFMQLRSPALEPYGPGRGSHYYGQMGATAAHTDA